MARLDGFFRDCKISNEEHDSFAYQNKMLAKAEDSDPCVTKSEPAWDTFNRADDAKRKKANEKQGCFNCRTKRKCKVLMGKTGTGAASIGGDATDKFSCHQWKPVINSADPKEVKKLLSQFKHGLR